MMGSLRFFSYVIPIIFLSYFIFVNIPTVVPSPTSTVPTIDFSLVPQFLLGHASNGKDCTYFDGTSSLSWNSTQDEFEQGSFTALVEWNPEDPLHALQPIVAHYNWEIYQDYKSVVFIVGKMNNDLGSIYTVEYPIDRSFFGSKHIALVTYNEQDGFISISVDNGSPVTKSFVDGSLEKIWKGYGSSDLSFGKSDRFGTSYFKGCIYRFSFTKGVAS